LLGEGNLHWSIYTSIAELRCQVTDATTHELGMCKSPTISLSEETVKGQVRNILSKLGAKDRTHAAMIGSKRGIIEF
jgi:hypothetical protein